MVPYSFFPPKEKEWLRAVFSRFPWERKELPTVFLPLPLGEGRGEGITARYFPHNLRELSSILRAIRRFCMVLVQLVDRPAADSSR
jgi:hypothetical protein